MTNPHEKPINHENLPTLDELLKQAIKIIFPDYNYFKQKYGDRTLLEFWQENKEVLAGPIINAFDDLFKDIKNEDIPDDIKEIYNEAWSLEFDHKQKMDERFHS